MTKLYIAAAILAAGTFSLSDRVAADAGKDVDTALILAVDVSNSVDASRYRLQMEGIASALEDSSVINAITGGAKGGIVISLVTWADHAQVALPWHPIRTSEDAQAFASKIRNVPQVTGEYTCTARMFEMIGNTIVPDVPAATRIVVDVSGDGIDNCGQPGEAASQRDRLVKLGLTINGLPIIVQGENDIVGAGAYRAPGYGLRELPKGPDSATTTLDAWYDGNVIGGPGMFLLKANGFEDFGRAFRQKFVTEISSTEKNSYQ